MQNQLSQTTKDVLARTRKFFRDHNSKGNLILFGSRARGDERDRSDFDIAVYGLTEADWLNWLNIWDESNVTLYEFDWVRMEDSQPNLLDKIQKEGIPETNWQI